MSDRPKQYVKADRGRPDLKFLQRVIPTESSMEGIRCENVQKDECVEEGWYVRWQADADWNDLYPVPKGRPIYGLVVDRGYAQVRIELLHPLEMMAVILGKMLHGFNPVNLKCSGLDAHRKFSSATAMIQVISWQLDCMAGSGELPEEISPAAKEIVKEYLGDDGYVSEREEDSGENKSEEQDFG